MGYKKEVTNLIVECWALGFTAEETVKALDQKHSLKIGLATVYRHRHSITAQTIIDELIRKQLRDIAGADNPTARMKYRDKLLAKLIPQRTEHYGMQQIDITQRKITVNAWKPEKKEEQDDKPVIIDTTTK